MNSNNLNNRRPGASFNMDLHTSQNDDQFGHLLPTNMTKAASNLEERKTQQQKFMPLSDSESEGEDDDSEDSDAGPTRWKEPSSLEMDCVFLDDEGAKDENALPEIFDLDSIVQLDSKFCMLCSEAYGHFKMLSKKNCRACGKSVCDNCSKANRRLSQLDQKKHKVCDECDALMANHQLLKMFEREAQNKKNQYEEK